MIETELHILSDRREGLLIDIGQIVVDNGFILVSQRLGKSDDGALLRLIVRGAENKLLALEEQLACHPRVINYESYRQEGPTAATTTAAPTPSNAPLSREVGELAVRQVEAVLPHIARDYPTIFSRLVGLRRALEHPAQSSTLHYAGYRVGVWVYKRDFALGGKLGFSEAVRQIALPALKQMLPARLNEGHLELDENPLCNAGSGGHNGHFFCGFLEGVLSEACDNPHLRVQEPLCRSDGAHCCVFAVSPNN